MIDLRHAPRMIAFLFCLVTTSVAHAQGTDGERAALARLVEELRALAPLVEQAHAQANPEARYPFQYDRLTSDIQIIERAVTDWLSAPATPRPVRPFHGDYR